MLKLWFLSKAIAAGLLALDETSWAIGVYLSLDPWLFWTVLVPKATGFGPVFSRFKTDRREVWLTFDDGPNPESTPGVLKLLDEYNAKATFFLIGQHVVRYPDLCREIVERGHSVGNHTQTHPSSSFWRHGSHGLCREIDGCDQAMSQAGVAPARFFRAPVGIKSPLVHPILATRRLWMVAWSARGYDRVSNAGESINMLRESIRPGSIILLHEGGRSGGDLTVVRGVLEHLKDQKLQCVLPPLESLTV